MSTGDMYETTKEHDELLKTIKNRFEKNMNRHTDINWETIQAKLETQPKKLWSLSEMEKTGGEPDIVSYDAVTDEYIFYDCSAESPHGRRNVCYDHEGQESRAKFKPQNNAVDMAALMDIELLTEEQYRSLQTVGVFDTKTSSWIKTPLEIRNLGGALFADRRYDHVFLFHNTASSYYGVRGFRGLLRV